MNMRKGILLLALLLATVSVFGQDTLPKQPKLDRDSIERLDATDVCRKLIGVTKDSLVMYMKGTQHTDTGSDYSDIFYVYATREEKNIPIQFFYMEHPDKKDGKLRVWKAEFISRKSLYWKTADLKVAFWVEYIRKPYKK